MADDDNLNVPIQVVCSPTTDPVEVMISIARALRMRMQSRRLRFHFVVFIPDFTLHVAGELGGIKTTFTGHPPGSELRAIVIMAVRLDRPEGERSAAELWMKGPQPWQTGGVGGIHANFDFLDALARYEDRYHSGYRMSAKSSLIDVEEQGYAN